MSKKTLTDDDVSELFHAMQPKFAEVVKALESLAANAPHGHAQVPVEVLEQSINAIKALSKIAGVTNTPDPLRLPPAIVDRGPGCDYNPFNGINW